MEGGPTGRVEDGAPRFAVTPDLEGAAAQQGSCDSVHPGNDSCQPLPTAYHRLPSASCDNTATHLADVLQRL
ncbi:unnamed protein product [Arctogadus glacialis]